MEKRRKLDKWVPHELTEKDRIDRLTIAASLLTRFSDEDFLQRIITCDEQLILYDNKVLQYNWFDANEPPKKKGKPNFHPKKLTVSVWWSVKGVVHYSISRQAQTKDSTSYCADIEAMHVKLQNFHPRVAN